MQNPSLANPPTDSVCLNNDSGSAISWSAILGGALVAVALAFILIALGSGLGLAHSSLRPHEGMSVRHLTYAATVWLIIVQWASSGLGGYLTGRLRTKWTGVHTHEVFFRDTAHGLLTWAVAIVFSITLVIGTASAVFHGDSHMLNSEMRQHVFMTDDDVDDPLSFAIDSLFRTVRGGSAISMDADFKMETTRLLMKGLKDGGLSDEDRSYVVQIVATHTGLLQSEAEKRVDDAVAQIRQTVDAARKTAASAAIYTFLSMLIGAFIACAAAALGGQERDEAHLLPM